MRRELLPSEPTTADELRIFAQTLDIQGNLELESGRSADAADSWKQAAQIYAKLKNESGRSQSLINRAEALYFPVVHIATHGNFSSKPEETWILTWGDRYVYVNELDNLLGPANQNRSSTIKILVLSGCETAQGDRRAVLGLAGVALRSRASSAIATLWSAASRAATVLMKTFYQQLATGEVNKAEALRRAQVGLLKQEDYKHPVYWAPYVMVGNWL